MTVQEEDDVAAVAVAEVGVACGVDDAPAEEDVGLAAGHCSAAEDERVEKVDEPAEHTQTVTRASAVARGGR